MKNSEVRRPQMAASDSEPPISASVVASWILWRRRSGMALPASALAIALVGLIGPSRVRTGDHRRSDVAAGYATGAAYLAALIILAKRDRLLTSAVARPFAAPSLATLSATDCLILRSAETRRPRHR